MNFSKMAIGDSQHGGTIFSGLYSVYFMLNFNSAYMIRSAIMIVTIFVTFLLTGANYKNVGDEQPKKHCIGYSVIAADKGVDCNGDTIKLIKVNGYFEREGK